MEKRLLWLGGEIRAVFWRVLARFRLDAECGFACFRVLLGGAAGRAATAS